MAILLKIIGLIWAAIGAGNIFMSPLLTGGSDVAVTGLLMFNVLLFILPGLVVYGIGSAITKKTPKAEAKINTKQCPFCAETIKKNAVVCRYCSQELPSLKSGMIPIEEYAAATSRTEKQIILDIHDGRLSGRQVNGLWMVNSE